MDVTGSRLLVVDNYDSFTYNLVQSLGALGAEVTVKRNDEITLADAESMDPDGIVISPGPGNPADPEYFGVCREILETLSRQTPTLGVCLGMQGFVHAYGGDVIQAEQLMHGKPCPVDHDGEGVFADLETPMEAGRYHSLVVDEDTLPEEIEATAFSDDDELMAVRHRSFPIHGVQFHPESILTPRGDDLLDNLLEMTHP
jgi:anthranilate synthase/aminodeoxychorismate synthase-like glutamine amidotransferase